MRTWWHHTRTVLLTGAAWAVVAGALGGIPRWVFGVETDAPIPLLVGVPAFVAGSLITRVRQVRRRGHRLAAPPPADAPPAPRA